jgi:uncharacterized protein
VLLTMVENGYVSMVTLLLEKGVDPNVKDSMGRTALLLAVSNGKEEVVELLLEKEADLNASNSVGRTALMLAAEKGYTSVVMKITGRVVIYAQHRIG